MFGERYTPVAGRPMHDKADPDNPIAPNLGTIQFRESAGLFLHAKLGELPPRTLFCQKSRD